MRAAGPWPEAVMSGESEKAGVIDGLVTVVTGYCHFHVVVETSGRQSLEVFEGADVFADGGRKILRLHKPQILAARVTQHITERMDPPAPFGRERNIIRRIIHLSLHARTGLEPLHRRLRRVRADGAQVFLHDAVAAQADNLVARGSLHAAVFISPTRSWLSAATEAASRDSFSKRGARIVRSSGVSPARP